MAIKLGINGFGRIGRTVLRIAAERPEEFEICGINLRKAEPEYMVYLMKYDSVFGRFPGTVEQTENGISINGREIAVFSSNDVKEIPWDSCGAEYIVESTGAFNTTELASGHLAHGAKKVVLSAPAKDKETPTYVMGVNHWEYDPRFNVVSNASCTTNCIAPLTKIVHDNFGIEQGLMSTIHSATSKQKPVDARAGRDWRTGRSVFNNIIPSTTGAAKACALVMPSLRLLVVEDHETNRAVLETMLGAWGLHVTCAVDAQEFVLELLTGDTYEESDLAELAQENGWFMPDGGTSMEDVG